MTAQSKTLNQIVLNMWQRPQSRRWLLLAIGLGIVLVMAFYTATDMVHLAHSHALEGADWVGYAVCHRITERSFVINGRQFPLCARCTGMYLGVALTVIVIFLSGRLRWSELPPLPILLMLIGFIGLMGIDGINSYSHFFPNAPHLYEPRNWLRLLTGMGTGLAMGVFMLPALAQTLWRQPVGKAPIGNFRELAGLVVVALTAVLLLLSNQPAILYVLALVSTAGLLFIITAINCVFLLILLRRDGRAESWRDTAVPLLISFTLALIEISAVSIVRFNLTGTMTGFPGL
ncbi:MAG: DUF2085 domain-containing protein [Ardenticatenaceae bacterium]|nr:DUF2085 domain-containing protein [Ardenticatenaceae bacterium]MCB9445450.1 DUF2085 domain-containing protein [Ardenticatenaceae bacterium]